MRPDGEFGHGLLLLARHGQTNDNLEPIRAQGFSDTPLNEVGRRQAHELAELLVGAADRVAVVLGSEPRG